MPTFPDPSPTPFRTREWLRLAVACVTNFAILAAPCTGYQTLAELPPEPAGDEFLLASVLPELALAELAAPMLDAGGGFLVAASPAPLLLDWRPPASPPYWRSPELPHQPARPLWPTDVPARGSLVRTDAGFTPAIPAPWQPGAVPTGGDPLPPPGVFGALPIEQQAGNCVIYGEVASGLDPVPKALVEIIGTGRVAETDAQGRFRIEGLPAGDFTAEASALNYSPQSRGVSTSPASPVELRFNLTVKPTEGGSEEYTLEEESVVGEYNEASQGDFSLSLATDTPTISAGLGKEDLSRTGSSDAAAAVSKISGANIVGGRYAVVRGLGDRYSNTLFNGSLIPSADPSKKAVQLDLFPSDLLQSVSIVKLFSPHMPAEFAGGTVEIRTLSLPEEPIIEVTVGTKWFSENPPGGFLGDPNTKIRFDEIDLASLPVGFDQPNGFTGSVADSITLHQSAPMRPAVVDDDPEQTFSVILGNTFEISKGLQVGAIFGLTRDAQNSYLDNELGRSYRFDNPNTEGVDPFVANSRRSETYARELVFGTMAGLSIRAADRHEIGFTYFKNEASSDNYVRTSNSRTFGQEPIFLANPYNVRDDNGEIVRVFASPVGSADFFEPLERSLDITQFTGQHLIYGEPGRGGMVSWSIADSTAMETRPHSRTYGYTTLDFADEENILPVIFDPSQFRPDFPAYDTAGDPVLASGFPSVNIFRESLDTTDNGANQRIDFSLPYHFSEGSDDRVTISFGYNRNRRDREVRGRFFTYDFNRINDQLLTENSEGVYQGDFGNQFHNNFNSAYFPNDPTRPIFGGLGILINDFSGNGSTVRNIDAGTLIESQYVGTELELNGWNLSGGFRIESEERSYQILPGLNPALIANPTPVVSEEEVALPGVILTREFGREDEYLVTAGWSRTVARPTFYEFAPAFIVDQATGDITRGNPDLENSSIANFDLRLDWKPSPETNVGIGLFHKDIDSPIVDAFDPVINAQSWINGESGTLQGLELEANTLYAERYRIGGNFTYIDSALTYLLRGSPLTTGFTGQPSHIVNLFAGYENEDQGIAANLVYNFTGSFLSSAPTSPNAPAIIEDSFHSLDLILEKSFTTFGCDGKVKLTLRNLLDSTRRQYFDGTDFTFREGKPGRSVSLSFEASF
jgi:hypothetical protein